MPAMRDSPMDGTLSDGDVVLNRVNIALARSQRIINSWLPQRSLQEETGDNEAGDEADSLTVAPMTESGGIGSKVAVDEESQPHGILRKKSLSTNDKLLEQLLGRKAAQAKKKSQEAGKSMSVSRHVAPKALASRAKPAREDQNDDEEEAGRAAAFKSRRELQPREVIPVAVDEHIDDMEDEESSARNQDTDGVKQAVQPIASKPAKKRGGTYLDELLESRARKSKKKKHKASTNV